MLSIWNVFQTCECFPSVDTQRLKHLILEMYQKSETTKRPQNQNQNLWPDEPTWFRHCVDSSGFGFRVALNLVQEPELNRFCWWKRPLTGWTPEPEPSRIGRVIWWSQTKKNKSNCFWVSSDVKLKPATVCVNIVQFIYCVGSFSFVTWQQLPANRYFLMSRTFPEWCKLLIQNRSHHVHQTCSILIIRSGFTLMFTGGSSFRCSDPAAGQSNTWSDSHTRTTRSSAAHSLTQRVHRL